MNFVSPELNIRLLKNINTQHQCLYFQFIGKFSTQTSIAGSKAWSEFFEDHPDEQIEFVWDCKEMTGFELNARKEWYKTMQLYKKRVSKVYVVSDRLMIRSAAKVMLQFFGIPSEINRSEEELPSAVRI